MKERNLILDYGYASVEYKNVKKFEIKFPFILIDKCKINLEDVKSVQYRDYIAWRNRRKGSGENKNKR